MPRNQILSNYDESGKCNHCVTHEPIAYLGEDALLKLLDKYRHHKYQYDCIVNISGGRDSSYTLLKLVKDYQMRVLALNYQNPFVDPVAEQNISRMVEVLNVKLVQFQLKPGLHEMLVRNNLLTWLKKPDPALVPVIYVGCKIIWPKILKIAKEYHVVCVINGGNPYEYSSFKKDLLGVKTNADLTKTYLTNLIGLTNRVVHNLGYLKPKFIPATIGGYLFGNQYSIGSRFFGRSIKRIDLFHYIPWNESEVIGRIQKELDWQYPKKYESTWRFDCRLSHLKDFMYQYSLGATEKDDFYSIMVRENKMTRAEALFRVEKENQMQYETIDKILCELEIEGIHPRELLDEKRKKNQS
jgi:hypothetical protein